MEALRTLEFSLSDHPADWPDDLLAEVGNVAKIVAGLADTERLMRALKGDE